MSNKKTKLSLIINYTTIIIEFDNFDVDLDQYFQAFKTLMVGASFTEELVNEWIINQVDDLRDEVKTCEDEEIPICTDAEAFDFIQYKQQNNEHHRSKN